MQCSCFSALPAMNSFVDNAGKKGITMAFAFPYPSCRFSGQNTPFFGKIGTGVIVSYFHKKIKTLEKCKALENEPFAIFAIQTGYSLDPQSLVSHPVENTNPVPLASYALRVKVMLELSTKKVELSTCKSGERGETLPPNLHQGESSLSQGDSSLAFPGCTLSQRRIFRPQAASGKLLFFRVM